MLRRAAQEQLQPPTTGARGRLSRPRQRVSGGVQACSECVRTSWRAACGVAIADDPPSNLKFEGVRGRTGRASNFSLYSSLKYFYNLLHASKAMITDNGLMGGVIAVLRYL